MLLLDLLAAEMMTWELIIIHLFHSMLITFDSGCLLMLVVVDGTCLEQEAKLFFSFSHTRSF